MVQDNEVDASEQVVARGSQLFLLTPQRKSDKTPSDAHFEEKAEARERQSWHWFYVDEI